MSWWRRWHRRLRKKLYEWKLRLRGARGGWSDPKRVLAPPWTPATSNGALWNRELRFQQDESILGIFITVRNELLHDADRVVVPVVAEQARAMARKATIDEVERLGR